MSVTTTVTMFNGRHRRPQPLQAITDAHRLGWYAGMFSAGLLCLIHSCLFFAWRLMGGGAASADLVLLMLGAVLVGTSGLAWATWRKVCRRLPSAGDGGRDA